MEIQEVKEVWKKVKNALEQSVPEHIFNTWISPLDAADYENDTLVLLSPQQLSVDILKKDWHTQIKDAIKSVLGENASFSLNYDADFGKEYIKKRRKALSKIVSGQSDEEKEHEEALKSLAQMQSDANLNLNLKFDNFVVGDNARFAYQAAFSVANNPSVKFNPLFIYGASGLGKTHLLQAIGHYILFNTKLKVRYIRMEDYFNEWMKCFQYSDSNSGGKRKSSCNDVLIRKFHQKMRNVDVLLMDDIQFLESKAGTMNEFFSTFEALYTNNKQIVIASDRQPADIPELDNRLKTRFEMGLVVDIVSPDYETRFEIIKAYAKELGVECGEDVFEFIAQNFTNNVRELKGAFNKVSAYSEFLNVPVTLENAQKALKLEMKKRELTPESMTQKVAEYFEVSVKDLKSSARQQKIAHARHIAIYMLREMLNLSYVAIGEYFNKKHTTIMYSYETVAGKVKSDKSIQMALEEIKELLKD